MSDEPIEVPPKPLRELLLDAYMDVLSFAKTLELACGQQIEVLQRGGVLLNEAERTALHTDLLAHLNHALADQLDHFPLTAAHARLHAAFPNSVPSAHQQIRVVAKDPAHDLQPASTADLRNLERAAKRAAQQRPGPRIVRP